MDFSAPIFHGHRGICCINLIKKHLFVYNWSLEGCGRSEWATFLSDLALRAFSWVKEKKNVAPFEKKAIHKFLVCIDIQRPQQAIHQRRFFRLLPLFGATFSFLLLDAIVVSVFLSFPLPFPLEPLAESSYWSCPGIDDDWKSDRLK